MYNKPIKQKRIVKYLALMDNLYPSLFFYYYNDKGVKSKFKIILHIKRYGDKFMLCLWSERHWVTTHYKQ
jgi:hypothetical protein